MFELVEKGIIRVIDLVMVLKDQGEVIVRELHELDSETSRCSTRCRPT